MNDLEKMLNGESDQEKGENKEENSHSFISLESSQETITFDFPEKMFGSEFKSNIELKDPKKVHKHAFLLHSELGHTHKQNSDEKFV